MTPFQQQYTELAARFRKQPNQHNHAAIGALYELKAALERAESTRETADLLTSVNSLLCLHASALQTFAPFVNTGERKDIIRLHKLRDQAAWKGDRFALKDIRTLRATLSPIHLSPADITPDGEGGHCLRCGVVILNKTVADGSNIRITLADGAIADYVPRIIATLKTLAQYPAAALIDCYNRECSAYVERGADQDWFDMLEIYSVSIHGCDGVLYSNINSGDAYLLDAYLSIQFEDDKLRSMRFGMT